MTFSIQGFERLGRFKNDWLDSRFHFSFAGYHDPARMGVGPLRVWNDDRIAAGRGFDPHPHRDMEIITYVRRGAISHRDNLGNEGRTEAGHVQVMSAGTGIVHAEYNLESEPTDIFQIWIVPDRPGHAPRWFTRQFPKANRAGNLVALASGKLGHAAAPPIHADATLFGATMLDGQSIEHTLGGGRQAYLVVVAGKVHANGEPIEARAGVTITDVATIALTATADSEFLIADLP